MTGDSQPESRRRGARARALPAFRPLRRSPGVVISHQRLGFGVRVLNVGLLGVEDGGWGWGLKVEG